MIVINLILLATLLIVVVLVRFNIILAVWSAVPLLSAAVLAEFLLASSDGSWKGTTLPKRFGLIGLIAGVVSLTLYSHIGAYMGIGLEEEAAGSGERLKYILAPLYALLAGGVGFAVGHVLGQRSEHGG